MSSAKTGAGSLHADGVLVAVTLIAAAGWMFSFNALRGLPPLLFIALRFLAAGTILGACSGRGLYALRGDARLLRQGTVAGVLLGGAMMFWAIGLHLTTAMGAGAFICSLGVVIAPLVAWLLYRERVVASTWLAITVATLGMACLALQKGARVQLADLFFLGSALSFSLQFTLNSRFSGRFAVLPLTVVQLFVVGLCSLAISALIEDWPAHVDGPTWLWLAASAVLATALRYFVQFWAQSRTTVHHAAFIMTLEPVWTALLASVWLGQHMRPMQLLGSVLVMGAMLISRWPALGASLALRER